MWKWIFLSLKANTHQATKPFSTRSSVVEKEIQKLHKNILAEYTTQEHNDFPLSVLLRAEMGGT